ncbi:hypothetical protein PG995_005135 [Apiospora arundinis]|uniref:Uncharacterized protein n=1 Tax=Apiospora kogelbergensis TaxID=1337665 RepID=A0AAW0QZE4_9PEZI
MRDGTISLVPSPLTGRDEGHHEGHPPSPFREHYEFRDWDIVSFFHLHAWCLIAMNRMLNDVYRLPGQDPASSSEYDRSNKGEAREFSRRIWP